MPPLSLGLGLGACHGARAVPLSPTLFAADFTTQALGAGSVASYGLSFARASAATVQTGASTVVTSGIAADTPRYGSDGTRLGLVLEEARTNLVPDGRDLTAGTYSAGSPTSTTRPSGTGPDGSATTPAESVVASGNLSRFLGKNGLTNGSTYAFSCWTKNHSGTGPIQIRIAGNGSTTSFAADASNPGTWERLVAFDVPFSGIANCVPAEGRSGTGNGGIAAGARDCESDLIQLELGKYATEAIVTSGGTATRAGERLFHPTGSALVAAGQIRLELKLQPKGSRANQAGAVRLWTDASDATTYCEISTAGVMTVSIGGATNTTAAITWAALDTLEIWVVAGGSAATLVEYRVNGGAVVTPAITGSALGPWTPAGAVDLLCNGTTQQPSAWVQTINAYKSGAKPAWA